MTLLKHSYIYRPILKHTLHCNGFQNLFTSKVVIISIHKQLNTYSHYTPNALHHIPRMLLKLVNYRSLLPAPFILYYLSKLLSKFNFGALQSQATPTLLQIHVNKCMHSTTCLTCSY
jgi:hypothetical protein